MTSPSTSAFFDKDTETLFITAHNSDGAGFYGVTFRIVKGEYRDRMIFPGY